MNSFYEIDKIELNNLANKVRNLIFSKLNFDNHIEFIDQYNYLAIKILETLDQIDPTEEQISQLRDQILFYAIKKYLREYVDLNKKEINFLMFLIKGNTIPEAVNVFFRSDRTLREWRTKILEKIGVSSIEQAIHKLTNSPVTLNQTDINLIVNEFLNNK